MSFWELRIAFRELRVVFQELRVFVLGATCGHFGSYVCSFRELSVLVLGAPCGNFASNEGSFLELSVVLSGAMYDCLGHDVFRLSAYDIAPFCYATDWKLIF